MFFRRSPPIDEGEVQRLRQAQEGLQQQLSQVREREAALVAELAQVRAELAGQRACLRPLQAFGQSFLDLQASLARMADAGWLVRVNPNSKFSPPSYDITPAGREALKQEGR